MAIRYSVFLVGHTDSLWIPDKLDFWCDTVADVGNSLEASYKISNGTRTEEVSH